MAHAELNESAEPRLREGVMVQMIEGVSVWLDESALPLADRKELTFWSEEPAYRSSSEFWDNLRVKAAELRVFQSLIPELEISPGHRVLELGAGQGWASAMLKREFPSCQMHAAELSAEALMSSGKWESLFGSRLDGRWACQAQRTPFADAQFDRVFTFAAFHHFVIGGRGREALTEALRLVKPGGRLVLLYEPCAPPWFERRIRAKLNRMRLANGANVEEDVLVLPRITRWARALGARTLIHFDTELRFRDISRAGGMRNVAVRILPFLGHLVPVGANITIVKD
jgi:ubiquinone/menaquinone biosynthesis C-methylase UbiE